MMCQDTSTVAQEVLVPEHNYKDPAKNNHIKIVNKSDLLVIVFNSGDTFSVETLKANGGANFNVAGGAGVEAGVEGAQLTRESKLYTTKIPKGGSKSIQFHGNQTRNYFTYGYVVDGEYQLLEINKCVPHDSQITIKAYDPEEVVERMPVPGGTDKPQVLLGAVSGEKVGEKKADKATAQGGSDEKVAEKQADNATAQDDSRLKKETPEAVSA